MPDEVAPPRVSEARPLLRRDARVVASARSLLTACVSSAVAQLMFSSDFVRQNDTPEIDATMKKMMIETALARP